MKYDEQPHVLTLFEQIVSDCKLPNGNFNLVLISLQHAEINTPQAELFLFSLSGGCAFRALLWHIWKERNPRSFDDKAYYSFRFTYFCNA